jgi:hypothetical protein
MFRWLWHQHGIDQPQPVATGDLPTFSSVVTLRSAASKSG